MSFVCHNYACEYPHSIFKTLYYFLGVGNSTHPFSTPHIPSQNMLSYHPRYTFASFQYVLSMVIKNSEKFERNTLYLQCILTCHQLKIWRKSSKALWSINSMSPCTNQCNDIQFNSIDSLRRKASWLISSALLYSIQCGTILLD